MSSEAKLQFSHFFILVTRPVNTVNYTARVVVAVREKIHWGHYGGGGVKSLAVVKNAIIFSYK